MMIEAMFAGLRIDRHATDRIQNFYVGRMGGLTMVLLVMMCVRIMGMCRRSFPTAATRLTRCGGG
jgi:hypothetical protein